MLWRPKVVPIITVGPIACTLGPGFGLNGQRVNFLCPTALAAISKLDDWSFLDRWRQLFEAEWPHSWCIGVAGPSDANTIQDLVAPSRRPFVVRWPEATGIEPFAAVRHEGHYRIHVLGQADESAWEQFLGFG